MTRHEAHISKDWRLHGLAHLLVARLRDDGSADVGVFLVDVLCLGLKETLFESDVPASEAKGFITAHLPEGESEFIHPACAKKLIEGAIANAERLGFAPHRDYRKARRVLSGLDATLCPTEFTFGRDGRPYYVQGPNDTPERVKRVLAMLEARCGPDGFDCELADPTEELAEDELHAARSALVTFFNAEPEGTASFHEFSGMLTAMSICPTKISPALVYELLWGPAGHAWRDDAELKNFRHSVLVYWDALNRLVALSAAPAITTDAEPPDPIDIDREEFESPVDMVTALTEWAGGFIRVTEEWPEPWGDALSRPDLAPHWAVLRAWADPDGPGNLAIIKGSTTAPGATPRLTLPRATGGLARALRPPRA